MLYDSHFHTEFSSDSKLKLSDAFNIANKNNLGLISTEHYDYDFEGDAFKFDVTKYFESYSKYRSDNYLLGIEIGLTLNSLQFNRTLATNNFDYVLGSVHFIDGTDIFYYFESSSESKETFFNKYLNIVIDNIINVDFIDALGHIDYPCRYVPYEDKNLYYNDYPELFNKIFKILIDKNIPMEINTRRLGDKSAFNSLLEIYSHYSKLGGKYITIGSDAHVKEQIGANFDKALEIAKLANLTPVYFKERKLHIMK